MPKPICGYCEQVVHSRSKESSVQCQTCNMTLHFVSRFPIWKGRDVQSSSTRLTLCFLARHGHATNVKFTQNQAHRRSLQFAFFVAQKKQDWLSQASTWSRKGSHGATRSVSNGTWRSCLISTTEVRNSIPTLIALGKRRRFRAVNFNDEKVLGCCSLCNDDAGKLALV